MNKEVHFTYDQTRLVKVKEDCQAWLVRNIYYSKLGAGSWVQNCPS